MHREIDQPAADARAARLVAALLVDLRLGLGRDAIRTHQFWTGKACPTLLLPRWQPFVASVEEIVASLDPTPPADEEGFADEVALVSREERLALDTPLPPADEDAPILDEPDIDHDELAFALAEDND